jgi:plastocyanin
MIKKVILLLIGTVLPMSVLHATVHTIGAVGLVYSPVVLNAMVGDTVIFNAPGHPTVEVSQTTWNANGTTPLPSGFMFPSGQGQVVLLSPGTRYYVCTAHINAGMKGQIIVHSPSSIGNIITAFTGKGMVFPSPTLNQLTIIAGNLFMNRMVTLNLYDLTGQLVHSQNYMTGIYGDLVADVSFLRQGIYIAEVKDTANRRVFRFLRSGLRP